jgi:16S rRNA G966 N2-methylase RsmD
MNKMGANQMLETISGNIISSSPAFIVPQQDIGREVPINEITIPPNIGRPIDWNKVSALAGSMAIIGLTQPIVISEDFVLVAGNHRLEAARQLGWETIRARVVLNDSLLNELIAIDENLIRNELNPLEQGEHLLRRGQILIALGKRAQSGENQYTTMSGAGYTSGATTKTGGAYYAPPLSTESKVTTYTIAKEMGYATRTVQERMKIARDISEEVRDKIRNTEIAGNKSELLRLAKVKDPVEQMKIAEKIVNGEVKTVKDSVSSSEREKTRVQYMETAEGFAKLPDGITLTVGDFFEYEGSIPDGSVDMILTDPPYVAEWAENIASFMTIANRILRPGGALVMYLGHVRLPEYFHGLEECESVFKENALQFYWVCALEHSGARATVFPVGAICAFKPILIAMKPPVHKPYQNYSDLLRGSGREKDAHDWQQSAMEILPLVDALSKPGDIILDPFCGSGSTGVAARMHARKYIGVDLDSENIKVAYGRLSKVTVERSLK